jgi:hypothetical protein
MRYWIILTIAAGLILNGCSPREVPEVKPKKKQQPAPETTVKVNPTGNDSRPMQGVEVVSLVKPSQPASKAFQPGDIITKVDNAPVALVADQVHQRDTNSGNMVMTFARGGKEYSLVAERGKFGIVFQDYLDLEQAYAASNSSANAWDSLAIKGLMGWRNHARTDQVFEEPIADIDKAIAMGCQNPIVLCAKANMENFRSVCTTDEVIKMYNRCLTAMPKEQLAPYILNLCYLGLADMYYEKGDVSEARRYADMSRSNPVSPGNFSWTCDDFQKFLSWTSPERQVIKEGYTVAFSDDFSDPTSGLEETSYRSGKYYNSLEAGYYCNEDYGNARFSEFIAEVTIENFTPVSESTFWEPKTGFSISGSGFQAVYISGGQRIVFNTNYDWVAVHFRAVRYPGPNVLRIVRQGGYIQYYINEKWLATLEDAAQGQPVTFGFHTISASVTADDLKVLAPAAGR